MRQIQIKLVGVTRKRPGIKPPYNVKELSLIPLKVLSFYVHVQRTGMSFFLQTYIHICTIVYICSCSVSSHPCFPNLTVAPGFHGAMSPA